MSRTDYAVRHKALGLCRSCPRSITKGSAIYCIYHREQDRVNGRRKSKKAIAELRGKCLEYYGKECRCCGIRILQFLTIDHKEGKGNIQRKKLFGYNISGVPMYRWLIKNNFPNEYQVLCMNCNWATRYGTICPHQLER